MLEIEEGWQERAEFRMMGRLPTGKRLWKINRV
jgi:hypothetical protein